MAAVAQSLVSHRHSADAECFYRDVLLFQRRVIKRSGVQLVKGAYSDGILATLLARPEKIVM